jgi:hypothetical protein
MSENSNGQTTSIISYKAIGLAVGLVFGGIVGWLLGNPLIFSGGGLILGLAVGTALDSRE